MVVSSLHDVLDVREQWRHAYNTERSHESLGRVPPLTFLPRPTTAPEEVWVFFWQREVIKVCKTNRYR